jgi:tetratricopeptide (TPR) repeat protein
VAYGSLLPERRLILHARIVEALETLAGERLADHVERLAAHAFRGEVWDKALLYCRQAGVKAMGRSAYWEAVVFWEQALAAAQQLPKQRDTLAQALDLCVDLRYALQLVGELKRGFEYLRQAATLAEGLGEHRRLGELYLSIIHACWSMGEYDDAMAYSQRTQALAAASGNGFEQAVANGLLGTVYFSLGDYRRAIAVLRQFIASLTGELLYRRFGALIHSVRARAWLVSCLAELGEFAEGCAWGEEAVRIAKEAANPSGAIFAQSRLGHLVLQQGALERALAVLEPVYAHCRAADIPLFLSGITVDLGLAYALSGRAAEALHLIDQVMVHEETGTGGSSGMLRLGEVYLLVGRPENASQLAERALVLSRDRKERGNQAWALRLLGATALHDNPPDVALAETHYRHALALAAELGMRPLVAHCHAGLGTLYTTTGRWEQARAELSVAIELYRVMEMPFWLTQAEATLAQVLHATGSLGVSH